MPSKEKQELSKRDLLESLIKSLPGLVVLFDSKGTIHWWNDRLEFYTGYPDEKIKTMDIMSLVKEDNKKQVKEAIDRTLQNGEANLELRITTPDRDSIPFLLTGRTVALNEESFVIATGIDISSKEKENLERIIEQKNTLLEEVHHRIKNNLSIASSLLSMQADTIKDEDIKKAFNESISRIRSMALVHQMLYEQMDFSRINFNPYVRKMVDHLETMYQVEAPIQTIVDEVIYFNIKNSIPCALIIHELTSNAIKHGCKGQDTCEIKVTLTKEDGSYKLVVWDNGIEQFNIDNTSGLGLTLIRGLTSQLGGTLHVDFSDGTAFVITFET